MKELFESSYISMMSDMNAELRKEIENLQQELQRKDNEIKQLQEDIVNHIKIASEYKEQMIIKDNNWNELKEWLDKEKENYNLELTKENVGALSYSLPIKNVYREVLDKIKELEENK